LNELTVVELLLALASPPTWLIVPIDLSLSSRERAGGIVITGADALLGAFRPMGAVFALTLAEDCRFEVAAPA
jgi:hypothetical protein